MGYQRLIITKFEIGHRYTRLTLAGHFEILGKTSEHNEITKYKILSEVCWFGHQEPIIQCYTKF